MNPAETTGWGSWESHEEEQLARWASLSPAERLEWLEEAKVFQALVEEARGRTYGPRRTEPGSSEEPQTR